MLDLQSGVHLEKVELAIGRQQKLDGSRVHVADRVRGGDRRRSHPCTQGRMNDRRRRLLDDLLVTALDRALALAEMHDVAVLVGEHLHLDVPRVLDVALEIYPSVAERRLRLARRRVDRALELIEVANDAHALAAATRYRLQEQRQSELGRESAQRIFVCGCVLHGRQHRHADLVNAGARRGLVAHRRDREIRRADEREAGFRHGCCERRVLREEAVPGVNRVCTCLAGGVDDRSRIEVAVACRSRADANGRISHAHMNGVGVGVGINRHRRDAHLAACPHDAHRDLSAVGDQDPLEHAARV